MPVSIRHGWRTRVREVVAVVVTFAAGVVAATAGAGVAVPGDRRRCVRRRGVCLVDALVLASSWRLTSPGLKIPTIVSRRREIAGDSSLVVTPAGRWVGAVVVTGERGMRALTVNPLVSPTDLRSWFAADRRRRGRPRLRDGRAVVPTSRRDRVSVAESEQPHRPRRRASGRERAAGTPNPNRTRRGRPGPGRS